MSTVIADHPLPVPPLPCSAAAPALRVRAGVDARPPYATWVRPLAPEPADQPMLDLRADRGEPGPPVPAGVHASTVAAPWAATPAAGLPDPTAWSLALAQALVESLDGQRGVGQLSRWVDDVVLATVTAQQRQRAAAAARGSRPSPPLRLRTVRVQHPARDVAEVSAHLTRGRRSVAMAFRLEARNGRWLCTALELGPRPAAPDPAGTGRT